MKKIATIRTDFQSKFGVPRQSGVVSSSKGRIVFEEEYRDPSAFKGLEEFSHIWVIWEFSEAKKTEWSPTVRPPLLGGNKRMGVFATRSPFRPNPIGLSVLKLDGVQKTLDEGTVLLVSGCDMIDNTPIFDIKPYLAYCDSVPDALGGFTDTLKERCLEVVYPDEVLASLPKENLEFITEVLKGDPRPSYHEDAERVYGFCISGMEIKFSVKEKTLTVISAKILKELDKNIVKSKKK